MASRKYTKHKKKYWRKNTNTKDVEESITEHRKQQLLSDMAINKKDEELFAVDNSSSCRTQKCLKRPLHLRSEYHCVNHSLVTLPVHSSKNRSTCSLTSDASDSELDIPNESMCYRLNYTIANDVRKRGLKSLRKSLIESKPTDIWSQGHLTNDGHMQSKPLPQRPGSVKYSSMANIEIPHSGTSYNPSFADHQRLLQRATNDEERKLKKLAKLHTNMKMPRMNQEDRERQWLLELSEGLVNNDSMHESDEGEDDTNVNVLKVPTKRKTSQQKRKEKLWKKTVMKQKLMKTERKRLSDVYRIKSIKREIIAKENKQKENMLRRSLRNDVFKTKRIGKYKYVRPSVDVQLSSDLCGSLRLLQNTGNLMTDRFVSLQRRNLVEPKGSTMKIKRAHKKSKK